MYQGALFLESLSEGWEPRIICPLSLEKTSGCGRAVLSPWEQLSSLGVEVACFRVTMTLALPGQPLCLVMQTPAVAGDPCVATLESMTGQGEHCLQRTLESISLEASGLLCHLAVRDRSAHFGFT